ncbi:hypothetical protein Purlil1_13446 [Purpureocillium lilacinum]|uniref:Uncharacterized protein n=1 Tax=Purpureocillium lilacinum TaxID=33203 RepID=A0ABR0BE25_PURLI|nr:hypothetical protein Purlil1_13446 [Purpureocillium lilacinum]
MPCRTGMANDEFQGSGGNLSSLPVQCFAETSAIDGATRSMGYFGQATFRLLHTAAASTLGYSRIEDGRPSCGLTLPPTPGLSPEGAIVGAQTRLSALQGSVNRGVQCDGVESRGVKVDSVKQRSGRWAEWQGTQTLVGTPVLPWSYPLSWAMCNKSAFTAIQKRLQSFFASFAFLCPHSHLVLHTTRPASLHASHHTSCRPAGFTPHVLQADFASHHMSCKPTSFTPHILRASHHTFCKPAFFTPHGLRAPHHLSWKPIWLHTTHPASFTPHILPAYMLHTIHPAIIYMLHTPRPARFTPLVLQAYMLHTIHPASLTPLDVEADFVSHHSSCKTSCFTPHILQACRLHTTRPASFTPHILQAYMHHTTQATRAAKNSHYPARTLFTRVDEQLTGGGRHKPGFGFTTSATTALNVKGRCGLRSSGVAYRYSSARLDNVREEMTSESIIACEPFGHFEYRMTPGRTQSSIASAKDPSQGTRVDGGVASPSTDGTWKAPAMKATAIVHIVHDQAHYRPVVRHPAFVANRSAATGVQASVGALRPLLGQREI